jgi:PPOX class probable F420-dependent enzyme
MADDDALYQLFGDGHLGVLATIKRDGRPQLSNVLHVYDAPNRTLLISVTDDRVKTRNLRRDPRASYHVSSGDGWSFAVGEGTAELSEVATDPHDATVEALVGYYRDIQGEHPDWDEYRREMVEQKRLLLRLPLERVYGQRR